ncbi:MAG: hypothetical protein CSA11_02180 [Chloroflexi bacterium]|nr:MAG: hypothetical protein CSA11_02180 [Chloroflexota bacterium]
MTKSKLADWHPLSRAELLWFGLLFGIVTTIAAAAFWPVLPCSDDTLPHFYRTVQLHANVQRGAPFLQWGPEMLRGYGYTIFLFYAPLTYWLLETIHLLGFDFGSSMQILYGLVLWLAGWGGYVLARQFLAPVGAFVAGLAYLFAPYFLYDAIQRGALPETLALALAPWALAAALHALDNPRINTIARATVLWTLLILAHNVVPLFALSLLLMFALVSWTTPTVTSLFVSLRTVALVLGFALGLTLFFWLPGLVELQYTQSRQPNPPYQDWPSYEQHIVPVRDLVTLPADPADPHLMNPPVPRTLGWAQAVLGLAGMVSLIGYRSQPLGLRRWRRLLVLAVVTITAVFFSSQWSLGGWRHLPLLNFIQLPTRFLGLASLGVALLAGVAVAQGARWASKKWWVTGILALGALLVSLSGWAWLYPRPCPVPVQPTREDLAQATTWQQWYAEAQAELLPCWVQRLPPEDVLIAQYQNERAVNRLRLPDTDAAATVVTLLDWQSGQAGDVYRLEAADTVTLVYQAFYFPGWRAALNGRSLPITITAPEGFMQVTVPAGEHVLDIRFGPTRLRWLALLVSGVTAVALVVCIWLGHKKERAPEPTRFPQAYRQALPMFLAAALFCVAVKWMIVDRVSSPLWADRLQHGQLTGVAHPVVVQFDNEFLHLGYEAPDEIAGSENFVVTQYWTPLRDIGVPYGFSLQVVDEAGQVWSQWLGRPFNYTHFPALESWQPGEYARDAHDLKLLPGVPPGEYWLETAVFRRDTDLSLMPAGGEIGSAPDKVRLGRLRVLPGEWQLDAETAQVGTYAPMTLTAVSADVGSEPVAVTLLGWTVPDVVWRPGELAPVELLWQGRQSGLHAQTAFDLWLVDDNEEIVAETAVVLDSLEAKNILRTKVSWQLPPGLETGVYKIILPAGGQNIELGQWHIDAPDRIFEQPEVDITSNFAVDFARLVGHSMVAVDSRLIDIELVWQASAETPMSYRVFVHLRDENGNLVTQSDAIPDHWTRPTTGWTWGEFIKDKHTLTMPATVAPGEYTFVVGFYEPMTGERLGETEIGKLTVKND